MSRTRRSLAAARAAARAAALFGLLALSTAACSPDDDPATTGKAWPSTSTPVATDGLIWASGSTVHLPDGSTMDTEALAGAYVVAGPGVWFASPEPGDLEGNELPELRVATADGVEETGAHPAIGSLTTSADEATTEELDWSAVRSADWYRSLHRTAPLWNADRSWGIAAQEFGATPVLESAEGDRVTTSVPDATGPLGSPDVSGPPLEEWALGGWLDETTVGAITPSRDGFDVNWRMPVLLTCTVPTGECTVVEGTEEGVNLPADRPYGLPRESSIDPG